VILCLVARNCCEAPTSAASGRVNTTKTTPEVNPGRVMVV
jgi:hypothetical protein